jgi:hypothetical protein
MSWIARGIGQLGSQAGEAYGIAQDWRARQQEMQIKAAQQKLQEMMLPLQIQEIQARLREQTQPKPAGLVTTRGGGTAGATFTPGTGYSLQTLEAGADPETVKTEIKKLAQSAPQEFRASVLGHADAIDAGADPMKELAGAQKDLEAGAVKTLPTGTTLNRLQARADEQFRAGDMAGYAETQKEINQLAVSAKPQSNSMWNTIAGVQQGDPAAIGRWKIYQDAMAQQLKERGEAFGRGRLFTLQTVWEDGVPGIMTGFEALQARNQGRNITIGGALPAQTRIAYQQLNAEATPALAGVRQYIKAFDNPQDQAIFAKVLAGAGTPEYGNEGAWLRNVLGQALRGGLSPDGRMLTANLSRLGETMGRFRSVAGLQATDSAMALTMGLLPGPTTPDSAYAKIQLDNLQQMIQQASTIPAMRNQGATAPNAPPPGSKVISLDEFLRQR